MKFEQKFNLLNQSQLNLFQNSTFPLNMQDARIMSPSFPLHKPHHLFVV